MQEYDVIIIGGGPGGYRLAQLLPNENRTVALIEKEHLGGTCLNEGCIPSKSLLYSSKMYLGAVHGEAYGFSAENIAYDQAAAVARKNKSVATLKNGVAFSLKQKKVNVITAEAHITKAENNDFTVEAGGESYHCKTLVVATGSGTAVPPIEGLKEALADGRVITNREALSLEKLPESMICIGGGVIGLEMAYYYASVGVAVTVIEMMDKIAGRTDKDVTQILMKNLKKSGIQFVLGAKVTSVNGNVVAYTDASGDHEISAECILLASGRVPNTEGIGLENTIVAMDKKAIIADEKLHTNIEGLYAIGDCNGKSMLAHTAYREAEVIANCMNGIDDKINYDTIPAIIYTVPETASVGETEETAQAKGIEYKVVKSPMNMSGRYIAENGVGDGFVKILTDSADGNVIGVQIIGSYASEMIYAATIAVEKHMTAEELRKIVIAHPSVTEAIKEALFMIV